MKLNTKTRYGIRAMIEFAMLDTGKGIFQKEISKRQDISYKYLDHIIAALKTKGLIANVEGKKSGYHLARRAEDITIYDIYQAFEPSLQIIDCIKEETECKHDSHCAAQELWCGLNKKIVEYLEGISLKDLADQQHKLNQKNQKSDIYYI